MLSIVAVCADLSGRVRVSGSLGGGMVRRLAYNTSVVDFNSALGAIDLAT